MKTELSEYFSGDELERAKARLAAGEPIEYITGKAYFYRVRESFSSHQLPSFIFSILPV